MNILLQCGLGIKGAVESKSNFNIAAFIKLALIFSSIIFLWLFFSKVLFSLFSGIFVYVILFPVSAIVYDRRPEAIIKRPTPVNPPRGESDPQRVFCKCIWAG
ncbi:hypothetical protein [Treponema sp. R80B11-R83G3]